jgi:hypothetical protein
MCNERERLLDYLYDECTPDERRLVERHLEGCDNCREEISGLRGVRLNLLAWDVPDRGSVWKPFAPPRVSPWYRDVPAWALAAAASVTFILGMAGGVVSRQFLPAASASASAAVKPSPTLTPQISVTPSSAEMAAMERRILTNVQTQLDRRIQPIAAHPQVVSNGLTREEVVQMLSASEDRQNQARLNAVKMMLQDSQRTFVTNSRFRQFVNDEFQPRLQYELSQVALQGKQ